MRAPGGASGAGTAYAKRVQLTKRMAQYHNDMVVEAKVRGKGELFGGSVVGVRSWGSYVTRLLQSNKGRALPSKHMPDFR